MRGTRLARLLPALMLIVSFPALIDAAEIVSTMRNVNAVMEARGFFITPAYEDAGRQIEGDYAPTQAFEIVRPDNRPVTIGRLYTSCTCVQLEAPKRTFDANERAVFELRNVRATPAQGQIYAIYIQVLSPIRTTLRYDTFVQSNPQPFTAESILAAAAPKPAAEPAAEPAVESPDKAAAAEAASAEASAAEAASAEAAADSDDESADTPAAEPADTPADEPADEAAAEPADKVAEAVAAKTAESEADKPQPELIIPEEIEKEMKRRAEAEKEIAKEMAEVLAAAKNGKSGMADGKPVQTISLITIGVRDLAKSIGFYKGLGWSPTGSDRHGHAAFQMKNGQVLVLHPMESVLKDRNMESASPAAGGVSLAIYVNSRDDVDAIYDTFVKAGAKSLRSPAEAANGSYSAYAADPDGHPWEITHEPRFVVDIDGRIAP